MINYNARRNWSIVLAVAGSVGVLVSAYLTRQAAMKETAIKKTLKEEELKDKKVLFKKMLQVYAAPLAAVVATVASVTASTIISRKTEASLGAIAVMAGQGWNKYKGHVKKALGVDKHQEVIKDMAKTGFKASNIKPEDLANKELELYYDENLGYFMADTKKILEAYNAINQRLHTGYVTKLPDNDGEIPKGSIWVSLYDFATDAGIDLHGVNANNLKHLGWSDVSALFENRNTWVRMKISKSEVDDNTPCNVISWLDEPHLYSEIGITSIYSDPRLDYVDPEDEANYQIFDTRKESEEH